MTKDEADKKLNSFREELIQLAYDRGFTLAYVASHNIKDGHIYFGIANTEKLDEDMKFTVASVSKMYYDYLIQQGKDNEDAVDDVMVAAMSGISYANLSFIQSIKILQKKLESLGLDTEAETCEHAIEELTRVLGNSIIEEI